MKIARGLDSGLHGSVGGLERCSSTSICCCKIAWSPSSPDPFRPSTSDPSPSSLHDPCTLFIPSKKKKWKIQKFKKLKKNAIEFFCFYRHFSIGSQFSNQSLREFSYLTVSSVPLGPPTFAASAFSARTLSLLKIFPLMSRKTRNRRAVLKILISKIIKVENFFSIFFSFWNRRRWFIVYLPSCFFTAFVVLVAFRARKALSMHCTFTIFFTCVSYRRDKYSSL